MASNISSITHEDYVQSSNALFHFMQKDRYLKKLLLNKAIIPRYCKEDIEYLHLRSEDTTFKEIAVLQKCFCDIPLHKINERFTLTGHGETFDALSENEKVIISQNNTHLDFYGKYGIAFPKHWCEQHNFQPIHYINETSAYAENMKQIMNYALNIDDLPDEYANDLFARLAFVKPIRGSMGRNSDLVPNKKIQFYKNFHDEQEWRYVPGSSQLSTLDMERVIANNSILENIDNLNANIELNKYRSLWLHYNYDDIRYIIVPDDNARLDIIDYILALPETNFNNPEQPQNERMLLISKVIVLDEIGKD